MTCIQKPAFDLSLYLVTDRDLSLGRSLVTIVDEAIKGGVTMVQLREKACSTDEFITLAKQVKQLLIGTNIPLIINDNIEVALAVAAEGLHIGQGDIPYPEARKIMGPKAIIGLSVENNQQAKEANSWDVDYIGISPVFLTSTKIDTAPALGLDGIANIKKLCSHPTVAIGGINMQNIASVISAGADGVAVVSAICSATNPKEAAHQLFNEVLTAKQKRHATSCAR
jgi:thiamine-phosphate pyrophosphorylase